MKFFQVSDEQFIERVRKRQEKRRKIGAFLLVFGLLVAVVSGYMAYRVEVRCLALFDEVGRMQHPNQQQEARLLEESRFYIGFRLGFILASGFGAAIHLMSIGVLLMMLRNRKDRLLLRCWDGLVAVA